MNRTRKSSPRTYKMETTGPKVPSRYLSGPTGSCHDNCKCAPKQTTETKPINPFPKKVPKPPADRSQTDAPNSAPRIMKSPSVVPKITTRSFKKDAAVEPKKHDLKMKTVNSQAKTFNLQSSRTARRRLSDISIPNKDMSIPLSRFPNRRLSEVIIHPNTEIASVSNASSVRGSGIKKNESGKDSKLPLVNKKFSSFRTNVSYSKGNQKVSPLKTNKSVLKPEVKGSRKSKPLKLTEDVEMEETQQVREPNNCVEITQSQSQESSDCCSSRIEVKAMKDDENWVVEPSKTSIEDDIIVKDDQNWVVEPSKTSIEDDTIVKDDQNWVVEPSKTSIEDDTLVKDDQNEVLEPSKTSIDDDTTVKDDQNWVVEPSKTSIEDDTIVKDDQNWVVEPSKTSIEDDTLVKDDQNEVLEPSKTSIDDDTTVKDDQNWVVEPSKTSIEDDTIVKDYQNGMVEPSETSIEDDTMVKDDQNWVVEPSKTSIEDDIMVKDDQNVGVESLQSSIEDGILAKDEENEVLEVKSLPTSMENDTSAKDGQQDDNISDSESNTTRVEKLPVETDDCSLEDLRFRRGTILSPESKDNSPTKLQFMKGKELEIETEDSEKICLKILSSDGVVSIIESQPIIVDLKHQEMEEKKAQVLINNVIEETASKLIQQRKSKVKALVGAFETVTTKSDNL